jgi:hypothetical protein
MKTIHVMPFAEQLAGFDLAAGGGDDCDGVRIGETTKGMPILRPLADSAPADWITIEAGAGVELDVLAEGALHLSLGTSGNDLSAEQWEALRRLVALEPGELMSAAALDERTAAARAEWIVMPYRFGVVWRERLGFRAWLDLAPDLRAALVQLGAAMEERDVATLQEGVDRFHGLMPDDATRATVVAWLEAEADAERERVERHRQALEAELERRRLIQEGREEERAERAVFERLLAERRGDVVA